MSKTIHRQIGKFGQRSADDASVAMIIKEVNDMEIFLGKLVEHTRAWRDSWTDILVNETRLADSFHDVYQKIPRTGDSANPPEDAPQDIMHRVALLHTSHNELKTDMLEEVGKVERLMVAPLGDCKTALKPVKKAIEKREHKKLDFERFQKAVDSSKAKKNKTDKDYSAQSRTEAELEKATFAYQIADDYLRDTVPPILAKIVAFLPLVVEIAVQVQFTLLQHSYSALHHYANENGFADLDGDVVVSEWEGQFLPIKQEVEANLKLIAKGKAVAMPMNAIQDKSIMGRLPSMPGNPLSRGKKPPPPPPPPPPPSSSSSSSAPVSVPAGAENGPHPPPRGRENSRPSIGSHRSSTSLSSRFSHEDTSPVKPVLGGRPSIGHIRAASHASPAAKRSESPPPPLPGPRPQASNDVAREERPHIGMRGGSYAGGGGGGLVTPTPLAGLTPSMLRRASANSPNASSSPPSPLPSSSSSSLPSPQESLAAITNPSAGRIGGTLAQSMNHNNGRQAPPSNSLASIAAGKKKPPPPPPKKKNFGGAKDIWVKAIFPFEGQTVEDLSFDEGDQIRVIKKTNSTDDWWVGEVNGRKGQFPANYCEPVV